jgi:hypothetical protein
MRRTALLTLATLSAFACRREPRPREAQHEAELSQIGEPTEPVPRSPEACAAACTIASQEECTRIAVVCDYEPAHWLKLGPHVLRCQAALAASCAGPATGVGMCTSQCENAGP